MPENLPNNSSSKIQGIIGILLGMFVLIQTFFLAPVFTGITNHSMDIGLSSFGKMITESSLPLFSFSMAGILLIIWSFEKLNN